MKIGKTPWGWGRKQVMVDTFIHVEASLIIKYDFDRKWYSAQFEGNARI
jgi:hypothetical protein